MRQLYQQCRRLDRIQPEVAANIFVIILRLHPVVAHDEKLMIQFFVVGDDHSTITDAAEVLAGEEAKAPASSHLSGLFAFIGSRDRLCRVLDYRQRRLTSDLHNRVHIRQLAVQVNRHDRLGILGDRRFDLCRVNVVADRVNIDKYGFGTHTGDTSGGGEKGKWRRNHFVAFPDP